MDQQSEIPVPPDPFKKRLDAIASQLRKKIGGRADILEASSRFGVYPSTIQKILDGRTLSRDVKKKICAQAENSGPPRNPGSYRPMSPARLKQIYQLYQDKGSLAAVGREIGVTRERVRQLMRTGSGLKLFDYKPYRPPVIPKRRLLKDYKKHLTLKAVGKIYNVSSSYIGKLFLNYGIDWVERQVLRASLIKSERRRRLIAGYRRVRKMLGHHPTAAELRRRSYLLASRIAYLWGSLRAFRRELGIERYFALRVAAEQARRKMRVVSSYRQIRKRLGYHPLAKHLEGGPRAWRRLHQTIRYRWGNFRAFRKELGIPTSTKELRSLRRQYQKRGLDLRRDAR